MKSKYTCIWTTKNDRKRKGLLMCIQKEHGMRNNIELSQLHL